MNPPRIAGIPNEQIQAVAVNGFGYGPVAFVVDDLDGNGVDDTLDPNGEPTVDLSGTSDNQNVVRDDGGIQVLWLGGLRW